MTDDRTDERCLNCGHVHYTDVLCDHPMYGGLDCACSIEQQTIAAQAATIAEQAREIESLCRDKAGLLEQARQYDSEIGNLKADIERDALDARLGAGLRELVEKHGAILIEGNCELGIAVDTYREHYDFPLERETLAMEKILDAAISQAVEQARKAGK